MTTPTPEPEPTDGARSSARPRDWLRLAFLAPRHPKVVTLPNDGARWAWIVALCEAKMQSPEGRWVSDEHFRACLGVYGRYAPALYQAGLVDLLPDGRVVVHNWTAWQDPRVDHDKTYRERHKDELAAKERARRARQKADRSEVRGEAVASVAYTETETQTETETDSPERGSPPVLGVTWDDPRRPVADILARRYRFRAVSDQQWERLWECVDNEYPQGTARGRDPRAGWRWLADFLTALPRNAGDPIEALFGEITKRQSERAS